MKIAIVTGASTGIGRAAAIRLQQKGFHVLAGVRREGDAPPDTESLLLDVTSGESVDGALKKCRARLSKASVVHLVNNAGIAIAGPIEAVSLARWREQFDVNVFGLLAVTQAFLPFIRATSGRIVNLSSVSGLAAAPYLGPYSSSKFAVEAISDSLRRELAQFGCHVVLVEPGPVSTPIWGKGLAKEKSLKDTLPPALREVYGVEVAAFQKMIEKSVRDAVPVEMVSDVIEKALTAARPKTRYVVGTKALHAQMAIGQLLPDRLLDKLLAGEYRKASKH
jgi:NAD(P)-dependent dehydrogenase (short-subunit alcohol dehydrogenase family)